MGRLYIECFDKKLKLGRLEKAVYDYLGQKTNIKVELVFKDFEEIKSLNKNTRGIDKATDVLSYPTLEGIKGEVLRRDMCKTELEGRYVLLGSIVLCDEKIRDQAEEYGHTEDEEREYLIIHGLLHLFGYDHVTDADNDEMRKAESEILDRIHAGEKR